MEVPIEDLKSALDLTENCGGKGGKPGPCSTGGGKEIGLRDLQSGGLSRGQRERAAMVSSQAAHTLTAEAHKKNTAEAHSKAAEAHSSLGFHPDLSQSAKGRHLQLGERHRNLAKALGKK